MRQIAKTVVAVALALSAGSGAVQADEIGEALFGQYCATCHGADAAGAGPLAEMITDQVPDLMMLATNNDGEFPLLRVIHVIDGRTGLRSHGGPMPVYGALFSEDAAGLGTYGEVLAVRGRILSIAQYLESVQK